MKSLSDIQDQKQRHRSSVKTEDGFYDHYLGQNYWFGEVFVEQLNGHHETFGAQFIKLIISGELPMGPESDQDSRFWSNKQLFSDCYCERPCRYRQKVESEPSFFGSDWSSMSGNICLSITSVIVCLNLSIFIFLVSQVCLRSFSALFGVTVGAYNTSFCFKWSLSCRIWQKKEVIKS